MSLANQLSKISNGNSTPILDRKSRHKLHSVSLIYDPKTAATQDYHTILSHSLEALNQLINIDPIFSSFKHSIFSETSISIDRSILSKNQVADLNSAINNYIYLLGPYWNLTYSYNSIEWLIRRFQIQIHNGENLLLSLLPYYSTPLFFKTLNIIPKLPPLLSWLNKNQAPTQQTIRKGFNDLDFVQLYTEFLLSGHMYKQQLVFFISNVVPGISNNSTNEEYLRQLAKTILRLVVELISLNKSDFQISAYTLVTVINSTYPLSYDILKQVIELVVDSPRNKKLALVTVSKLYEAVPGIPQEFPALKAVEKLPLSEVKISDKLFIALLRAGLKQGKFILDFTQQMPEISQSLLTIIISDLIHYSIINANKQQYLVLIEYFLSSSRNIFISILQDKFGMKLTDLEVVVLSTLGSEIVEEGVTILEEEPEASEQELVVEQISHLNATNNSFLIESANEEFTKLTPLYINSIKYHVLDNFAASGFSNPASLISFLLRVAVNKSVPLLIRIETLEKLKVLLGLLNLSSIFFVFLALLTDSNDRIRKLTIEILQAGHKNLKAKNTLENILEETMILKPSDMAAVIEVLVENKTALLMDKHQVVQVIKGLKNNIVFSYLTLYSYINIPYIKIALISMNNSSALLYKDFLNTYIEKRGFWKDKCFAEKYDFEKFERQTLNLLDFKKNSIIICLLLIQKALESDDEELIARCFDLLVAKFSDLKLDYQLGLVLNILENDKLDAALLQSLPLTLDLFNKLFEKYSLFDTSSSSGQEKRRRRSSSKAMKNMQVAKLAETHLKNIIILLETFEKFVPGFVPTNELVANLFNLLNDLETLGHDGNLPILYSQECLTNCLYIIIKNSIKHNIKLKTIRPDMLVSIIRTSSSPQLQNRLLLVISELAVLEPEFILHSIMPIFTFMGVYTVKQDDEYSFYVIEQTLRKVIPVLSKKEDIEFLLSNFISAFNHIPRHRRVKLFYNLASILGVETSGHVILFLLGKQYYKKREMRLEFIKSFMGKFDVKDILILVRKYLGIYKELDQISADEEGAKALQSKAIFDDLTIAELPGFKKSNIVFLNKIIEESLASLKLQMSTILLDVRSDHEPVLQEYNSTLGAVVDLLNESSEATEEPFNSLLSSILTLLPINYFIQSIGQFLSNPKMLNNIIFLSQNQFEHELINDVSNASGNVFIDQLITILSDSLDPVLTQTALATAAAIIRKYDIDEDKINSLLVYVVGQSFEIPELIICKLTLLSNIVMKIGMKILKYFNQIIPSTVEVFYKFSETKSNTSLQTSVVLLYTSFIKKLPQMMVSYLPKILVQLLNENGINKEIKLSVMNVIYSNVDSVNLFKVLIKMWCDGSSELTKTPSSIALFLNILTETITNLNKNSCVNNSNMFLKFLLTNFEFLKNNTTFDKNTINKIESLLFNCQLKYVIKLNDKNFRPIFSTLVDWSFSNNHLENHEDFLRIIIFLKFFNKLQDSLKSIITNYYTYFLDKIEAVANAATSADSSVATSLQRLILISFNNSFRYDQEDYWIINNRFEKISELLNHQLAVVDVKLNKHLIKACTSFAINISKVEEHKRAFNKLLIDNLKVQGNGKFVAVKVFENIYMKVGSAWLSLLPQLVPTIAELLEDDDEKIELEVRKNLVKVIEDVLGESLDKYLE